MSLSPSPSAIDKMMPIVATGPAHAAACAAKRSLAQKPARSVAAARPAATRRRAAGSLRIVAASAASFGSSAGGELACKSLRTYQTDMHPELCRFGCSSCPGDSDQVNVFPRFKERDPYRILGVDKDVSTPVLRTSPPSLLANCSPSQRICFYFQATYEEIQEARNFLVNEHKVREGDGVSSRQTVGGFRWRLRNS